MKRLLYTLLLPALFLFSSCQLDTLSRITNGVKMIGKCCKGFSISNSKMEIPDKVAGEEENSIIYPFNIADPKMMIR